MSLEGGLYNYAKSVDIHNAEKMDPSDLVSSLYMKDKSGKLLARAVKEAAKSSGLVSNKTLKKVVKATASLIKDKKSHIEKKYRKEIKKVSKQLKKEKSKAIDDKVKKTVSAILNLSSKKETGLKKKDVKKLVKFIQKKLPTLKSGPVYCKKNQFSIPRTIERTEDGSIYIHLKSHGIDVLGKGYQKVATLSIKYNEDSPELVANCICDAGLKHELDRQQKIKGMEKLVSHFSHGEHIKEKSGQARLGILFPLYDQGSVSSYMKRKRSSHKDVSFPKKLAIARDSFQGAQSLHERGYIHRDLHLGNILVKKNESPVRIEAAVSDFGGLMKASDYNPLTQYLQHVDPYMPPEYFEKTVGDSTKGDVYALGAGMLSLFAPGKFDKLLEVSKGAGQVKNPGNPHSGKYAQELKEGLDEIRNRLKKSIEKHAKKKDGKAKALAYEAISGALHPNPSKRLTASQAKDLFSKACKKALKKK